METPRRVVDYLTRLNLIRLDHGYHPVVGRGILDFNTAALAPEINVVKAQTDQLVRSYQLKLSGSKAAGDFLKLHSIKCRELISKLLLAEGCEQYLIDFYSSTSRALEIAINETLRGEERIQLVLSPFEHPTEGRVVDWVKYNDDVSKVTIERIVFKNEDWYLPWQEQETKLVASISEKIRLFPGPTTLLISEVFYATGQFIPVDNIISRIRSMTPEKDIRIIVDGAHMVGNLSLRIACIDSFDFYVFSSHKWLFSPEPGGILITSPRVHKKHKRRKSYDSWLPDESNLNLPYSTANVRLIAGLYSVLNILDQTQFETVLSRSTELVRYFSNLIKVKFEILGQDGNPSGCLLAIYPKSGFQWTTSNTQALQLRLADANVNASVLNIDPKAMWVRLSFPYFMDIADVTRLVNILMAQVR